MPNSYYLYSHYGSPVSVTGVVVGVMSSGDFAGTVYISEPSGDWDSYVASAEGMPVFGLSSINSACAVVGASITVVGDVVDSNSVVPADITAANTPGTGMNPTSCTVNSTGNTMTQSISLGSTLNTFGGALEYTGMTTSATFYAVSPTSGTLTESSETETSTGQFWATLSSNSSTNNHLFRSPGIAGDEYVPSTAPATVATWAGNPQRILIDTTTFGGSAVDITVGQTITCTTGSGIKVGATAGIGLIDYTLGYARLLIFPTSVCTVGGSVAATTAATADSTHFHVGTLDLNRFYSTTGATTGSVPVTSTAYARRLAKASLAIVDSLGEPDILSLQEVQDLPTLTDLANSVNALGGASYVPYLIPGSDPNSLNLGFLVKSMTLLTDSVIQVEAGDTYTTASGGSATLWERPPLVLQGEFVRTGKNYPVTVIDVHLTPRANIGDPALGPDVRAHRAAQASALSALVQSYQSDGDNVIVAGNLNAFEFSDGYVDVTGVIDGSPAAASAVTLYQATSTTSPLTDFVTDVTATSRYNYIENGDAESIEHILASATVTDSSTASASLASYESAVTQPHFTADFAAVNANSSTTAAGLTPHDGFVVSFLIPPVPTTASISPAALNFGSVDLGASTSLTATVTNTTTFTSTVNVTNIAISGADASDFTQTNTCSSLAEGATCTITVTFAPKAVGTRTGLLTVTNDSTSDPTLTVTLNGTGLDTTATLTPASATFPSTLIGSTSTAVVFTYTNTSEIAETVSGAAVTGDFSIQANTCTSGSIAASGACTISVVFTPTAAGARTGTLTVTDSSTGNATLVSTLNGTGLADLTTSVSSLSFGNIDLGSSSAAQTFTVTNDTSTSLTLSGIAITGDFSYTSTCGSVLASQGTCAVSVVFTPTALGTRTGTATIAAGVASVGVSLTGNGVDFTIVASPASGTGIAGDSVGMNVILTPEGGFSAAVALTCTTNASGSTCTPSSNSVTLTTAATDPVSITTTSQYTVIGYSGMGAPCHPWVLLVSLLSIMGVLFKLPRARLLPRLTVAILMLGILGLSNLGCSGRVPDKNANPTYPGTYTYTFSATDGTVTHTATYTLAVSVD